MTRKRIFTAAAAVTLTLGLGAGIAAAQTDPGTPSQPPGTDSMHDGDMDAMQAQMPEDMGAQCETMHTQVGMSNGTMDGSMMDGSMMDGSMMDGSMMGRGMMDGGMTAQS